MWRLTTVGHGTGGWRRVRIKSEEHAVDVITNASRIAESVSRMTHRANLQEAFETGAHNQLAQDMS